MSLMRLHNYKNSILFMALQEQDKNNWRSVGRMECHGASGLRARKVPEWVDDADVKRHELARVP